MIKKIICPTDFSPIANNAVEYASRISQILNIPLQLINIQPLINVEMAVVGEQPNKGVSAANVLNETCKQINTTFNISCSYELYATTESLHQAICKKDEETTLIIMGTNGADDLYQFYFGTNTYNIIKKAQCPVLAIPENVSYNDVKKIVFAWDYKAQNKTALTQLSEFINIFHTETVLLHISTHKSEISKDVFRAFKNEIFSHTNTEIKFEQVYSENIDSSINEYMNKSGSGILAITFYDRGLIRNIFHGTVAKNLSAIAEYPILVLHL